MGDEFVMNNAADVENTTSIVLIELQLILTLFGHGDDGLFHCDDCHIVSVVSVNPRLVTGDDPGLEGWIICGTLTEILAHCDTMLLLLQGSNSAATHGMFNFDIRMSALAHTTR
jgi:hypothetical protein